MLEATSLIAIVLSRVERTASWSMVALPPLTVKSSRGICQIVSSSSGCVRNHQTVRMQFRRTTCRGVGGGEEAVLRELDAFRGLLNRDDRESNLGSAL